MDYPFENQSPERFQLFCQALLLKEFPGLQCLPVGQPDGGRDAMLWQHHSNRNKFLVFQVKFSRSPGKIGDVSDWLTAVVESEREKVTRLAIAGAQAYYLLTNVEGTGHWKTGSIDKVEATLTAKFGIKTLCLWRNDLCRRLDSAWDLKWAYPELMTGPDLIRCIIENGLAEHANRRSLAIRAFVSAQYNADQQVKFKQVDLQNNLFDLFIDLPLNGSIANGDSGVFFYREALRFNEYQLKLRPVMYYRDREAQKIAPESDYIGAASFLLSEVLTRSSKFFVLEGAPGQGKSTISQYICQVNRMRLLDERRDTAQVPEEHRTGAVFLPIKVDLRDFATWLARKNPFVAEDETVPPQGWDKSIESFLAALIRNQSGGATFDVSDLHAVFSRSAALVVLDGLDEVADIKRRTEVVAEIARGIERLKSMSASLRVIVTSRPTAFVNSPGLDPEVFTYLSLGDVTNKLRELYADKWLQARRAGETEAQNVKAILREKVTQPHIRELARNPMQLAILLNLIYSRGASLPDKRTALYDNYIDLFFSREAEKNNLVRDNRELLKDIHQYLAWLLHSETEQLNPGGKRNNGAIEEVRLKEVLKNYLINEGRDRNLAEAIFTGVVERVVALVSRVQGTYEFEVQPLREYFAARFLYETAPYSPAGNEQKGTKPDRFNAIARNFYWLNVTRFFAGCYSKGELSSLIDSLKELLQAPNFTNLNHPRILASTLLSDWVFSQQPKSVVEVVNILTEDRDLRLLIVGSSSRISEGQPLQLAEGCGRQQLFGRCWALLERKPPRDFSIDVIEVLTLNGSNAELLARWLGSYGTSFTGERCIWFEYGRRLNCLATAPFKDIAELLKTQLPLPNEVDAILTAGRADLLECSGEVFELSMNALLDLTASTLIRTETSNLYTGNRLLSRLASVLNPHRYICAFGAPANVKIESLWSRRTSSSPDNLEQAPPVVLEFEAKENLSRFIKEIESLGGIEATAWATSIGPWALLIDSITRHFGERRICLLLSILSAAILSPRETCVENHAQFDRSQPLYRRLRYARLRAGNATWWRRTLSQRKTAEDTLQICAMWATWASRNSLLQNREEFDKVVCELPEKEWEEVLRISHWSMKLVGSTTKLRKSSATGDDYMTASARMKVLLAPRLENAESEALLLNVLCTYQGHEYSVLKEIQPVTVTQLQNGDSRSVRALEICRQLYSSGFVWQRTGSFISRKRGGVNMAEDVAAEIVANPTAYPTILLAAAERIYRNDTAKRIRPLLTVAKSEQWFPQGDTR